MANGIESLAQLRAFTNRHAVRSAAARNAVNTNNDRYYQAAMEGDTESPALSYLLNVGCMGLKDYQSIGSYNAMNTAAEIATHRAEEETHDAFTHILPRPYGLRMKLENAIENRCSSRLFEQKVVTIQDVSTWLKWGVGLGIREQSFQGMFLRVSMLQVAACIL